MRIGHGYDVHRLTEGRDLILGGVKIPFEKGLLGHSDADVLLHAVADALLGAAAKGDIGVLFPDSDPAFAGADSLLLLQRVVLTVNAAGFRVGNIDCTVLCQRPKLRPYIDTMRKNIALACGVGVERVFPIASPFIEQIDVNKRGAVRRARIFYLRNLTGKKARIKEKRF